MTTEAGRMQAEERSLAAQALKRGLYVDDVLTSAKSLTEALETQDQFCWSWKQLVLY